MEDAFGVPPGFPFASFAPGVGAFTNLRVGGRSLRVDVLGREEPPHLGGVVLRSTGSGLDTLPGVARRGRPPRSCGVSHIGRKPRFRARRSWEFRTTAVAPSSHVTRASCREGVSFFCRRVSVAAARGGSWIVCPLRRPGPFAFAHCPKQQGCG